MQNVMISLLKLRKLLHWYVNYYTDISLKKSRTIILDFYRLMIIQT